VSFLFPLPSWAGCGCGCGCGCHGLDHWKKESQKKEKGKVPNCSSSSFSRFIDLCTEKKRERKIKLYDKVVILGCQEMKNKYR
jgi:hypothetical protein